MKIKHFSLTIVAVLLATANANACSCPLKGGTESQQIDQEFMEAEAVFVAKVVSVTQLREEPTGKYIVEYAIFSVSKVFKGAEHIGKTVKIMSHIGPGPCGRSVRNNPPWLEIEEEGKPDKAAIFSGEWLIYAYGSEPYELSFCDRSFPMNLRGKSDADYLRKRQRQ